LYFFDTAEAYGHRGIEESKNKSFSANWRKKIIFDKMYLEVDL